MGHGMLRYGIRTLLLVGGILALAGCSGTKLVQSWEDEGFSSRPINEILVLGVFKEEVNRRVYEDGLVEALTAAGVSATAGYTLMPDVREYDEEKEVRKAVKAAGVHGVMIARLKGIETQERVVPPRVDYYPSVGARYGLYGYYGACMHAVVQPAYTVEDTVVSLEITLFSTENEKMVWGGDTESVNPASGRTVTREAARLIIRDLKNSGLI